MTRLLMIATALLTLPAMANGQAPADAGSDRAVAKWVLRLGGSVVVHGSRVRIWGLDQLPAGEFQLHTVNLVPLDVEPSQMKRLSGLRQLRELYISGRSWHSLPTSVSRTTLQYFAGMVQLEKFALSLPVQTDVQLEDNAIEALAPLTNLVELRVAQARIKGHTLAPFTRLRALDVKHTRFDDEGMKHLASMPDLTKLYLRDTLVTDEGLRHLSGLGKLAELDLYGTKVTDTGLAHLRNLNAMRSLNLLGAEVTDAGLDALAGMTRMESLNLYRTKVTNAGLQKLKAMTHLRELDLRYTP